MDKELKLRKDIKVVYRDTAWCNDSVLEEWVPTTFPSLFPKRQALIWDSFRAHMSENTKKVLKNKKVDSIVHKIYLRRGFNGQPKSSCSENQ